MRRRFWQELGLFPRLAAIVALGFLLLSAVMGFLGLQALNASTSRILEERLVLTEMASSQIEALFQHAFYELEKATTFAPFNPAAPNLDEEYHLLAHAYGRIGTLTLGVYFLDNQGRVVLSEPSDAASSPGGTILPPIRDSLQTQRSISQAFIEPRTGHPAVALTIPVQNEQGEIISYLSGLIDLSSPSVMGPLEQALKLGHTGHAELVTGEGKVVASTVSGDFLHPGEHAQFYRVVLGEGKKAIETVPYEVDGMPTKENHIMALVPLTISNWGLAVGGDERETLAPVLSLRRNLFLSGLLLLGATLAITLWGARRLVRPVRTLTQHARAMAEGYLVTPIQVTEGGEIGILGRSLEEMRLRLQEAWERLTRWNLELEEKVQQRSQELAELQARLDAERLKEEFISQVSHELNTPLGFIKGYASTLLRPEVSPDEETRREFLSVIHEEAEKLEALVQDLLDTSRIRSGTFPIEKKVVDLVALLRGVVARAQTKTELHSIALVLPSTLPPLKADPGRLEQVLNNLLDNALKYSPVGNVVVSAQVGDRGVQFTVSDEGEGIPPEDLERIFDAFYRRQTPATNRVKGSGLGLAICRGIVEAHGGRLWAESTPGKGSRFHFILPLTKEDEGETGPSS